MCEIFAEAEVEDLPLAYGQMLGGGKDRCLLVDQLEPLVVDPDRIETAGQIVLIAAHRRVERYRAVRLGSLKAVKDLLLTQL